MRLFQKFRITLFFLFAANIPALAQGTYYNAIDTGSVSFVTDLHNLIYPHTRITYDNFDETNVAYFASRDTAGGDRVVTCVYSGENYVYTPPFAWTTFSREHTWCQSWMPTVDTSGFASRPEYSDQHHLYPVNQNNANGRRSNHPLGNVTTVSYQYLEGKLGTNTVGQTVYEPRESHKGDAARALLYMSVCYNGYGGHDWTFNNLNNNILPNQTNPEAPQDIATLLQWAADDPPDDWEKARNEYVYSIQGNRNPFIDHPEYIDKIDFATLTKKTSSALAAEPTNYPGGYDTPTITSSSITVKWGDPSGDVLPSGYLLKGSTVNSFTEPLNGTVYTDQTNLSGGAAQVNVAYGSGQNTFSGLSSSTNYYFRLYPYNGNASSRTYKTASYPAALDGNYTTAVGTTVTSNGTIDFGTTANNTAATTGNTGFAGVRIGSGGGSFKILNPGQSIGSGAELQGIAPTSGSVNSVGIDSASYGSGSTVFTIRFDVLFSGGSSGTWYFFAGNGSSFGPSQTVGFTGAQVFAGLRFIFGASDAMITSNRAGSSWSALSGTPFSQNIGYTVAIVGNNSGSTVTYGANNVASGKYDLFINNVLSGNDLSEGALPSGTNVNAFRFYGENSAGNVATISLDNIVWYNTIDESIPLPVELTSFSASVRGKGVELAWKTATEVNNYGFEIEKKAVSGWPLASSQQPNANNWSKIGFVEGNGTTNFPKSYSFVDAGAQGKVSYRLKQIDRDGKFEYSNVVEIASANVVTKYSLMQNHPNPFNPNTVISYQLPMNGYVTLKVYDMIGKEIATLVNGMQEAGEHTTSFNASHLPSGLYFYTLQAKNFNETKKMILVK